jgi:hypothetical protein
MDTQSNDRNIPKDKNQDDGMLEKIARAIDPPSREVSDAELIDPGANTPAPVPGRPTHTPAPDPDKPARPSDIKRRP